MYTSLQYVHFDFYNIYTFCFICKSNLFFFCHLMCLTFSKESFSSSCFFYKVNQEYKQNVVRILYCVLGVTNV